MIIILEKPPCYEEAQKVFKFDSKKKIAFAYGDKIYNPNDMVIGPDVIVHEETHLRQQAGDPATWWLRYLKDTHFRMEQEIEAFRNQYNYICSQVKDKNRRYTQLHNICIELSSPLYGNMLSYTDAMRLMRK